MDYGEVAANKSVPNRATLIKRLMILLLVVNSNINGRVITGDLLGTLKKAARVLFSKVMRKHTGYPLDQGWNRVIDRFQIAGGCEICGSTNC